MRNGYNAQSVIEHSRTSSVDPFEQSSKHFALIALSGLFIVIAAPPFKIKRSARKRPSFIISRASTARHSPPAPSRSKQIPSMSSP